MIKNFEKNKKINKNNKFFLGSRQHSSYDLSFSSTEPRQSLSPPHVLVALIHAKPVACSQWVRYSRKLVYKDYQTVLQVFLFFNFFFKLRSFFCVFSSKVIKPEAGKICSRVSYGNGCMEE